jgi:hypothetical protein
MPFFGNRRRDFSIQPPRQQVDGTPFYVTDSDNIDFTLNNLNLSANLTLTGVISGTYGSSTQVPVLQIDQWGRITGVTLQTISTSGLALETNGTPNGDQTLLNLVAGTNMTINDDGLGNITFDATGGGGGVTSVTATAPLTSSGGATPDISTSMNTNKLIGRGTAGVGVMEEITLGTNLSLSGTTLNATGGGGIPHATASGTDTYTATIAGVASYADGDAYLMRFPNGNTTSATININSLGAISLYRNNDGPVIGGDIEAGAEMLLVYNSTLTVFQCIGTSPNTIIAYVTNDDTVTITKGQAVYAFGGTGDRMTVKLANNTSDATSAQTVGLVFSTSIAANQKGFIMLQGLLDGLNTLPTSTWNDGDPVYLGATAGSITPTKPYAPNHLVYLGVVTTASPGSAGRMYVKVQNGYELDELHNVQAQSPTVNDVLYYFGGTPGQWKTAQASTLLPTSYSVGSFGVTVDGVTAVIQVGTVGYVVMPYAGTITGWSITANVSGNIQFDVWKASGAIPTVANTIISNAAFKPKLTSSNFATSTTLTSWTTGFLAGDVFGFYVDSASTIKNATLTIRTTKT